MVMNSFLGSLVNHKWQDTLEYMIDLFPLWKSPSQGAATTLYTILADDILPLSGTP